MTTFLREIKISPLTGFCREETERGTVVSFGPREFGHYTFVPYIPGTTPAGILLQDVVNIDKINGLHGLPPSQVIQGGRVQIAQNAILKMD